MSTKQVTQLATNLGGYLVRADADFSDETAHATIVIRVPQNQLDQALTQIKSSATKVVSENISGQDLEESYTNIDEQLKILRKTKTKYETIRDQATKVSDILNVTRELTRLQTQIDNLERQHRNLDKQAQTSQITLYLAEDELALPYAPKHKFRPNVIFKLAVRSLVNLGYNLITKLIWVGVYAIVWLPLLLIVYWYWRRNHQS